MKMGKAQGHPDYAHYSGEYCKRKNFKEMPLSRSSSKRVRSKKRVHAQIFFGKESRDRQEFKTAGCSPCDCRSFLVSSKRNGHLRIIMSNTTNFKFFITS